MVCISKFWYKEIELKNLDVLNSLVQDTGDLYIFGLYVLN